MSLFFQLLILAIALLLGLALRSVFMYVPCKDEDLKRMIKLAKLEPDECFYDLGCGDGKTVFYVSQKSQAQAIGIELSWPLVLYCRMMRWILGDHKSKFLRQNYNQTDLSKANVVFLYLLPKWTNELIPRFKSELPKGARVISYRFPIENWEPNAVDESMDSGHKIYLYKI